MAERSTTGRQSSGAWTAKDDELLMKLRSSHLSWLVIKERFPNKSANACRKRHERLMEKRNGGDWDTFRVENIAKEYLATRKEMWSTLADRVGEKWQDVEAQCMKEGLRNLQASARSAARREKRAQMDDSGIASMDDDSRLPDNKENEAGYARSTPPMQERARAKPLSPSIAWMLSQDDP